MPKPTFLVCGGQRCGTTSLWNILNEHPEVYMATPPRPEPKFFLTEPLTGFDDYLDEWFSNTGTAKAIGEKSTSYLETHGTARRIASVLPEIKLIFMLRHPAERAVSNYRFSKQSGLETRSLAEAMTDKAPPSFDRNAVHIVSPFDYVRRGQYAELLGEYFETFDRSQLCILFLEDLRATPETVVSTLYDFIGVDSEFRTVCATEVFNETSDQTPLADEATVQSLVECFSESNRQLQSLVGAYPNAWDCVTEQLRACIR